MKDELFGNPEVLYLHRLADRTVTTVRGAGLSDVLVPPRISSELTRLREGSLYHPVNATLADMAGGWNWSRLIFSGLSSDFHERWTWSFTNHAWIIASPEDRA